MKLKYYTESSYLNLYDSISNNIEYYETGDNQFILDAFKNANGIKDSRIDVVLPNLSVNNGELANTIAVYESFKNVLSPKQASNVYLWTYLTHNDFWNYAIERWSKGSKSSEQIKDRFFCGTEKGSRIGFLRNAVSRLWWAGYLTYNDGDPRPYKYTELMLTNTDLHQSILERNFSMNKEVSLGILSAIYEINENPSLKDVGTSKYDNYEWRGLCKYVNRYGAVTLLDTLNRERIKEISIEYILNRRKKLGE